MWTVAFFFRARKEKDEVRSRILLTADVADAFRKLCHHRKMSLDEMMEELMRVYVKTSAPELKIKVIKR